MAKHRVAAGQIWREKATGTDFLVTRVYAQLFEEIAVLRQVGGEESRRVKLAPAAPEGPLAGYVQQSGDFVPQG